jgi:hypothetical protein
MRRTFIVLISCLTVAVTAPLGRQVSRPSGSAGAHVVIEPNVLVSRDGDFPHVELMVAANPKNRRNLVGGAITATRRNGGMATTAYASHDGGYSWIEAAFPEQRTFGGGDPQVAFTAHGTALFTTLAVVFDEDTGRTRAALHVYRSEDGGIQWSAPINLGMSYDHEQLVVDQSTGRFAGRIYLGALYGYPVYRVGLFRSDDDGRTWTGPAEAANGRGELGINVAPIQVFSNGEIFVPYIDFEFKPERRKGDTASTVWFVRSSDGGVTFSAPAKIRTVGHPENPPQTRFQSFPMFAVDNRSDQFRDRLYQAWNEIVQGHARVFVSASSDRGLTWSAPRLMGADGAAGDQYQPAIAVNSEGVLGVTWFDTRGSKDGSEYHQYFSASLDGGRTFLPDARVSTEPSRPLEPGNARPVPSDFHSANGWQLSLLTTVARWGNGGDYMGLTADARGLFHPFWADSRTGTFQIYTARVGVVRPAPVEAAAAAGSGSPSPSPERVRLALGDRVALVYDPARYDAAAKLLELPIRVRNVSQADIYGPIAIEVEQVDDGANGSKGEPSTFLNASNGKSGNGASFDYTTALGDLPLLPAGAITNAVVWRMRVADPLKTPVLRMTAWGQVAR